MLTKDANSALKKGGRHGPKHRIREESQRPPEPVTAFQQPAKRDFDDAMRKTQWLLHLCELHDLLFNSN